MKRVVGIMGGGLLLAKLNPPLQAGKMGVGERRKGALPLCGLFLLIFETIESGNLDFLDSFYLSINHKTTFTTLKSSSDDA